MGLGYRSHGILSCFLVSNSGSAERPLADVPVQIDAVVWYRIDTTTIIMMPSEFVSMARGIADAAAFLAPKTGAPVA